MRPRNHRQTIRVVEILTNVLSKSIPRSSRWYTPSCLILRDDKRWHIMKKSTIRALKTFILIFFMICHHLPSIKNNTWSIIRIRPQQIAHRAFMRHFLKSIQPNDAKIYYFWRNNYRFRHEFGKLLFDFAVSRISLYSGKISVWKFSSTLWHDQAYQSKGSVLHADKKLCFQ